MKNLLISNTAALPYVQVFFTLITLGFIVLVPQSALMWAISFAIYSLIGCLGISIGYHRLLTHKSFKTNKFWERLCTALGALAFTGSSIGWVGMHRQHHRFSDKSGDPHSPAVFGSKMLIARYDFDPSRWAVRSLITDKFHVNLHKYYFGILFLWAAFFSLFGLSTLFYVVIIPAVISIWVSTISNYVNHKWGYRNFETTDQSRNLWINALFTFGEGWHNNHHANPGSYTFKHNWWEIDPAAPVIRAIRIDKK